MSTQSLIAQDFRLAKALFKQALANDEQVRNVEQLSLINGGLRIMIQTYLFFLKEVVSLSAVELSSITQAKRKMHQAIQKLNNTQESFYGIDRGEYDESQIRSDASLVASQNHRQIANEYTLLNSGAQPQKFLLDIEASLNITLTQWLKQTDRYSEPQLISSNTQAYHWSEISVDEYLEQLNKLTIYCMAELEMSVEY